MHTWLDTETERQTPHAPSYDGLATDAARRDAQWDVAIEAFGTAASVFVTPSIVAEAVIFYNEATARAAEIAPRIDASVNSSKLLSFVFAVAAATCLDFGIKRYRGMLSARDRLDALEQKAAQREPLKLVK